METLKPAARKAPMPIRIAFIALAVAVLALHGFLIFRNRDFGHQNPGALDFWESVDFWLAFTLLASTVVLYFRAPRLADWGVVVILLWVLMSYFAPISSQ